MSSPRVQHFQITLGAVAKRLSDVYGGVAGANPDAALDLPYREIQFTTEADAFLGGTNLVTSTTYGIKVATAATVPAKIGAYETGPVKLSDLWGAGSGVLHILAIEF